MTKELLERGRDDGKSRADNGLPVEDRQRVVNTFRERAAQLRRETHGRLFSDSAALIRKDRDNR